MAVFVAARRKKALLLRFGSAKGVANAGLEDLESMPGISKVVAKKVHNFFHGEGDARLTGPRRDYKFRARFVRS